MLHHVSSETKLSRVLDVDQFVTNFAYDLKHSYWKILHAAANKKIQRLHTCFLVFIANREHSSEAIREYF